MSEKMEVRPWGHFIILDDEHYGKTKRIHVNPKQRLSYQSHSKRSEYWIIVQGMARVTVDERTADIRVGDSVYIPKDCKHRIENLHDLVPLVFIEVQSGESYDESDIIRYQDDYGRT